MSWAVGYDSSHRRDIGYGVPAVCDHPECSTEINRGMPYVCGNLHLGGEAGCGLFFCPVHRAHLVEDDWVCERCANGEESFDPSADVARWTSHKLTDESWGLWRKQNPELVAAAQVQLTQS